MSGLPIALDGFGTDARPEPEIEAAIRLAGEGIRVDLVGDQARLSELLQTRGDAGTITIVHADDEIAMDESPAKAVRAKPNASLCVAMNRVRAGEAAAVVSAGNSGAILAAALFRLGRIRGIDRPAIVADVPQIDGPHDAVLIDAGANTECTVLNLVQFAVLGATWSHEWHGVERPRVAVLSNGHEAGKGTALTRGAHRLLADHAAARGTEAAFDFAGYVEPHQLFLGVCDVVVTDGWTGNIALKLAEGAMATWPRVLARAIAAQQGAGSIAEAAIEPALQLLAQRFDPEAHGGAPLLGVDGPVIICHGAAGPGALHSALLMARRFAERGLIQAIARATADHRELFELARTLR
jgi:glycerol-3-phosphate acyltransferase PlsX